MGQTNETFTMHQAAELSPILRTPVTKHVLLSQKTHGHDLPHILNLVIGAAKARPVATFADH